MAEPFLLRLQAKKALDSAHEAADREMKIRLKRIAADYITEATILETNARSLLDLYLEKVQK